MKFKEIPLYPTAFWLDFWQIDSINQAAEEFSKRYGASVETYKKWLTPNQVAVLDSTNESPLKGEKRIVMNVSGDDAAIIVHEVTHVIIKMSKYCHVEIGIKSQEWVAYMMEYVFYEIIKAIKEELEVVK